MDIDWQDLRLFLEVARLGGLNAAARATGISAATLGRRVNALEAEIGAPLFVRAQTGYTLTRAGEDVLRHGEDVEAAMHALTRWRDGKIGEKTIRIAAGLWTSDFLSRHIGDLWQVEDHIRIELTSSYERIDVGKRAVDMAIRNLKPTDPALAMRFLGKVTYAMYAGRNLVNGVEAGMFVGTSGEAANIASQRWLAAHHGDRIAVKGNSAHAVRELVAAGAGLSVFPCFVGDTDPRLVRVAQPIRELETEQYLVMHQEERHVPEVRKVITRVCTLFDTSRPLFGGEMVQP